MKGRALLLAIIETPDARESAGRATAGAVNDREAWLRVSITNCEIEMSFYAVSRRLPAHARRSPSPPPPNAAPQHKKYNAGKL